MSDPLVPNFKKGVGRLATDRFDFEDHIEGKRFRHQANQIDLVPTIVIGPIGDPPSTNVQTAIAKLALLIAPPVVPDATFAGKGIIRLNGDLNANVSGGTALNPKVTGLQGFPLANTAPTSGYVLTWTGSTWSPQPIVSSFTPGNDLSGNSSSQNVIGLTGSGSSPTATVTAKNDIINFVTTAVPVINQSIAVGGPGGDFLIQAQGADTGTGGDGGQLVLQGGTSGGFEGDSNGGVSLQLGDGTYLVEATQVGNSASASRILSLVGKITLTSTQMPTNTGKNVIYIGNATTNPSASPVGGSILYSDNGRLAIRQSDNAQFFISPNYLPTRTVTNNYVMNNTDVVVLVDTTSLSISVTLPTPESGRRVIVKDSKGFASTRNISILRFGTEKIEGLAATKLIAANWGSITLDSDGTDWFII